MTRVASLASELKSIKNIIALKLFFEKNRTRHLYIQTYN